MEYTNRMNLSPEAAKELIEFLQHRVEAMASKIEFLEAENEILKITLRNEYENQ
jgi:hypothetical protein